MTRRFPRVSALLAPAVVLAALVPASEARDKKADDAAKSFFDRGTIPEFAIEVTAKDADALRREPRKYVTCVVKDGGKVIGKDVGIHLKGAAGSWRGFDDKPGLTLNMDKFADDQKFYGLDKFHLANSVQDPSYISEQFCGELFRAAGVPAARCSHAIVTLNGRSRGFYYLKEGYDTDFIQRNFGQKIGNFYDGGFLQDIDARLQVVSNKEDVKDQADLNALLAASRVPDAAERFKKMEQLMEMDKFLSYVAVDMILADWDGYPSKCNNYRIYHNPKTNKITFIPSGMDQMLGDPNWPVMMQFGGRIARKVIDTPEGKKRYLARTEEILKTVFKVDDMVKRLDELEKRVQPALAKVDPGAARDHKHHVNRLKEAVKQRHRAVTEQLKGLK
jgi:spore coat protein H